MACKIIVTHQELRWLLDREVAVGKGWIAKQRPPQTEYHDYQVIAKDTAVFWFHEEAQKLHKPVGPCWAWSDMMRSAMLLRANALELGRPLAAGRISAGRIGPRWNPENPMAHSVNFVVCHPEGSAAQSTEDLVVWMVDSSFFRSKHVNDWFYRVGPEDGTFYGCQA